MCITSCFHRGTSIKGRACNNADKSGLGQVRGFAVSEHPFQCGLCKKEEDI